MPNNNKTQLSDSEKQILRKKTFEKSDLLRINSFLNKSSSNSQNSLSAQDQDLIQSIALQRHLLELQRQKELMDKMLRILGVNSYLKLAKFLDKGKSLNRLSKENSYRIVILLLLAFLFDFLQFIVAFIEIIPVLGVLIYFILALLIRIIKMFVFFFIWKHYEIGFYERYLIKFVLAKTVNSKVIIISFLKYVLGFLNLIIGLILPFYPDLTIETVFTIILVRVIDNSREKDEEIKKIHNKIKYIKSIEKIKIKFS